MEKLLTAYQPQDASFDEFAEAEGLPRAHYAALAQTLASLSDVDFRRRLAQIGSALLHRGVTFTVYSDARGTERILPFDPLPRIVPASEWGRVTRGIAQRVRALNAFLYDVYHE
jgi:uncharacterized circularly permuted ATP-grasp superfamily protein